MADARPPEESVDGPVRTAVVRIVTAPDAACGGPTWSGAVAMIRGRLAQRFGNAVTMEHVTAFSPRFFELTNVAEEVQAGAALPVVFVGDTVVSRGGKLSASVIARSVAALFTSSAESLPAPRETAASSLTRRERSE